MDDTNFDDVLVLVWPDGRFRVSSEHGLEEGLADGGVLQAEEKADDVIELRHLPPEGGHVARVFLWPWEEVASA